MKKNFKGMSLVLSTAMLASMLTGCGGAHETATTSSQNYGNYPSETLCESADDCDAAPSFSAGSTTYGSKTDNTSSYIYEYSPVNNSESYDKPAENGYNLVLNQPLSTFAADVDTASYSNIRRMIEDGYLLRDIDPDAVRPEEFINYFNYDLRKPDKGDKFGVTTEICNCPWNDEHKLLFVGMKAQDLDFEEAPKSNLVFLIDVSGSMGSKNKLPLLQKSFDEMVDNLPNDGTVSIVTYSGEEKVVLEGERMSNKKAIKKAIDSLSAGGCTNGEAGMQKAYDIAAKCFIEGGNNRVIMATDGDLNVGISSVSDLEKFITNKKDEGIFLTVLGFGTGNYKDDKLEKIADCGNGNYSYIDSLFEGKKVLGEQLSSTLVTVAKDVKFQVEFNPEKVDSYRLIGYENRTMAAKDFDNDAKDGGEMGAGHAVVALYEIVENDSYAGIELKYQASEKKQYSDEYATVKVRYKEPDEDESRLFSFPVKDDSFLEKPTDSIKFAGMAAEFALLLSDSEYKGNASFEDIMMTYKTLDKTDEYQQEFNQLVKIMAKRS
jgi:Ca-activated chloride channel family protein